jgi:hypothetical protein
MDNTMNATQTAYAIARATYDTALAAHRAETVGLDWDGDFDAADDACEASRARHGLDALSNALVAAEEAMLDWSLSASLKVASKAQRATVIEVSTKGRRSLAIRAKLIDLALRLAA